MKPLHRYSRFVLLAAAFALALAAAPAALAEGHSEDETITLGSDDLGKSREELGDRSLPKDHDAKHRGKHGKRHGEHGDCDKKDCEHKDGECKECHGGKHDSKHKGKHRGMGYKRCVEKAVRAEVELDEAERVCRAIFPERKHKKNDQKE